MIATFTHRASHWNAEGAKSTSARLKPVRRAKTLLHGRPLRGAQKTAEDQGAQGRAT